MVRFGPKEPKHIGYTMDVSQEGMFVESKTVFRVGTALLCAIETRDSKEILLKTEVRWAKKYAANYAHKLKSGMGVFIKDFQVGREYFETFCPIEVCISCTPLPPGHPDAD